jgi:hypothetical protein
MAMQMDGSRRMYWAGNLRENKIAPRIKNS